MKLKIKKLDAAAIVPQQAHEGDVGLDLSTIETKWIMPYQRKLFKTGIAAQPEAGYELQLRPRSGNALKRGLTLLNSPATIEPTYRGDIGVILYNASPIPRKIKAGERIAQIVAKPYIEKVDVEIVDSLEDSVRGENGFGSSGTAALKEEETEQPFIGHAPTYVNHTHVEMATAIVKERPQGSFQEETMTEEIARVAKEIAEEELEANLEKQSQPRAIRSKSKRLAKKQAKRNGGDK